MLYRYMKIRQDSAKRAAEIIQPRQDDDVVAEIGYVESMRNELFLRGDDPRRNLVWFVRVPATGADYSCVYEKGFPDFSEGDDVRIIHPKDLNDQAGDGYVVGLHYKRGKVALVWVITIGMPDTDPQ